MPTQPRSRLLAAAITASLALSSLPASADVLLQHVQVYDGTGAAPFAADVRVRGTKIVAVAPQLTPEPGETVSDQHGLALAPGFIDAHSHADAGLFDDLDAATVSRQGVTTVVVGQDGESVFPMGAYRAQLQATPPAINVASFAGHATLRMQVMGKDLYRASSPAEQARMEALLQQEMRDGAFGLSTGLEYEQGHFATTEEVIGLSKVAAASHGTYLSHVRDESNKVFESYDEVLRIGREARIPVGITHIKMGATSVWHQAAKRMPAYFEQAKREDVKLTPDVYPYTYWHSTIRVVVPDRDFFNAEKVAKALEENGGAAAIRFASYEPDPTLAGKTLAEMATHWGITPVEAYMRTVRETAAEVDTGKSMEDIIGTSMSEDDVSWFVAHPEIAFCSDGALHGSHPRGAGAFPRILGHYVREAKVLSLPEAIRKMTSLPASRLGLKDRGRIAPGYVADLVLFDPATVIDQSTIQHPEAPPLGIPAVMVSGEWVIRDGAVTGKRPGQALRGPGYRAAR